MEFFGFARIGSGDDILAKPLEKIARNAAYTSVDIQNKLLASGVARNFGRGAEAGKF